MMGCGCEGGGSGEETWEEGGLGAPLEAATGGQQRAGWQSRTRCVEERGAHRRRWPGLWEKKGQREGKPKGGAGASPPWEGPARGCAGPSDLLWPGWVGSVLGGQGGGVRRSWPPGVPPAGLSSEASCCGLSTCRGAGGGGAGGGTAALQRAGAAGPQGQRRAGAGEGACGWA